MKLTSVYLPERQRTSLKELSRRTGLPIAEHIRRAIDAYLKRLARERAA